MNFFKKWRYLPAATGMILLIFVLTIVLDVIVAIVNIRFYSNAAFIVIFGVGGVFAGLLSYSQAISLSIKKDEFARWSVLIIIVVTGLLFSIPLAKLQGGEYAAAFRSFGIMTSLSCLLFAKGKIDI